MVYKDPHLSDQDLLLAADGELGERRQAEIRRHLQACWSCRSRMAELERLVEDFVASYHSILDPQVPADASAALLKAKLRQESANSEGEKSILWAQLVRFGLPVRIAGALAIASLLGILLWQQHAGRMNRQQTPSSIASDLVPNPDLTPGETVSISKNEICQHPSNFTENAPVPETTREAVFAAYGMKHAPENAYEVDFLITPSLGGSSSIRNLWPEPYHRTAWNAYRKDVLEERLHSLVCSGNLDLSTAQREIASNWIDAYKKYVDGREPK